ncbi:MAG: hypothetical protein BYD32DRAFT_398131, partial [Podila humilis]
MKLVVINGSACQRNPRPLQNAKDQQVSITPESPAWNRCRTAFCFYHPTSFSTLYIQTRFHSLVLFHFLHRRHRPLSSLFFCFLHTTSFFLCTLYILLK